MKTYYNKLFPILIVSITFTSVNQWSKIEIGNTAVTMALSLFVIILCVFYFKQYFKSFSNLKYLTLKLYFAWLVISVIRGCIIAENYWEWKQLMSASLALSLPILIFPFDNPMLLHRVLNKWFIYATIAFFAVFIWITGRDAKHYYLGPMLLVACFIPALKPKWQIVFLFCIILMLIGDFGARSQVIKSALAILFSLFFLLRKFISNRLLKVSHWLFYILPILLLYFGISGKFNVFEDLSKDNKYVSKKVVNGKVVKENLAGDTRTFIYYEVISSAIKHNYVIFGRTPARGNDSKQFGEKIAEELKTDKQERHSNEVCFPNVFTWLGLIGMLLYCSMYLTSSYLAVYRSNNIYTMIIGVFIAFHFAFGWIEDFNRFDISNISLWMAIAIGYSNKFRSMSNREFKIWIKTIFATRRPKAKLVFLWSLTKGDQIKSVSNH
ncbi:hypothetical protein [Mangrovibacterium diazotrophicum]|uniref:O-antigen ligase-like membrane protein n=1 Tax=Mangrovibacterium diazotrophicum TaxID=1261403 RepID=A0A419W928_9BACT|nr:hypothetical protein [Mangrovibacterium diazotrophicum]RKD91971.1 hypothetical protein BC643_2340 [Mangrovibacterium diazotrophicum]